MEDLRLGAVLCSATCSKMLIHRPLLFQTCRGNVLLNSLGVRNSKESFTMKLVGSEEACVLPTATNVVAVVSKLLTS